MLFDARKQIPALTSVADTAVIEPIRHLFDRCQSRSLRPLPQSPPPALSLDELSETLFRRGLGFTAVDQLRKSLEMQRRLIEWYQSSGMKERPTEHEVVAHIILPLLIALGWSEQLLAVEWRKIDLAIFSGTPTDQQRCRLVCEAKGMGHGLQDVLQQAVRYTDTLQLTACDKILLADGGRFYLYRRRAKGWEQQPSGYLNVLKIRENHLLPSGTNAIDTIIALTPLGIGSLAPLRTAKFAVDNFVCSDGGLVRSTLLSENCDARSVAVARCRVRGWLSVQTCARPTATDETLASRQDASGKGIGR